MATFYTHLDADQIISEFRDDEEEFGELIAGIAAELGRMSERGVGETRDAIADHGRKAALRGFAKLLSEVADEMEA